MKNNFKYTVGFLVLIIVLISCIKKNNDYLEGTKINIRKTVFPDAEYRIKHKNSSIYIRAIMVEGKPYGTWKKYDINGKLISGICFYDGKKVSNVDINDYVFKLIKNEESGFSIKLPAYWIMQEPDVNESTIIIVKELTDEKLFTPTITITKTFLPDNVSFDEYVELSVTGLRESFSSLIVQDKKPDTISEMPVFKFTFSAVWEDKKLDMLSVYFLIDKSIYNISCIVDGEHEELAKYKDLYEEIIYSLSTDV